MATQTNKGLKIGVTTVYVDDQDKALKFYTDVLGFAKKDDFSNGGFRWLTVAAPGDGDGTALQLALDNNPAAKALAASLYQNHAPAVMLMTDDLAGDFERIKSKGAKIAMPVTEVTMSKIAQIDDTCGNLVQLTQLMR
nr:VOC family protein [Kofleriaceae bacterium]